MLEREGETQNVPDVGTAFTTCGVNNNEQQNVDNNGSENNSFLASVSHNFAEDKDMLRETLNNSSANSAVRNSQQITRREQGIINQNDLYKELKYSRVNVFNRLVIFLLCLLFFSIFCELFSLGSTNWFVLTKNVVYHSIGLFLVCRTGVVDICLDISNAYYPCSNLNNHKGKMLCNVPTSVVNKYVTAMWVLTSIHIFCMFLTFILTFRMTCRPTRSKSAFVAMCLLLIALPCGVTNIVLFHFYTASYKSFCDSIQLKSGGCKAEYEWGFDVYIATLCFNFCACLTAFFLWVYSVTVRSEFSRLWERRVEMSNEIVNEDNSSESVKNDSFIDRFFRTMRRESHNSPYLSAKELGVTIDGADDWLYDYNSDFFYSFKLDMFWDPVTRCYYSRKLRSWQIKPREFLFGLRRSPDFNEKNTSEQ